MEDLTLLVHCAAGILLMLCTGLLVLWRAVAHRDRKSVAMETEMGETGNDPAPASYHSGLHIYRGASYNLEDALPVMLPRKCAACHSLHPRFQAPLIHRYKNDLQPLVKERLPLMLCKPCYAQYLGFCTTRRIYTAFWAAYLLSCFIFAVLGRSLFLFMLMCAALPLMYASRKLEESWSGVKIRRTGVWVFRNKQFAASFKEVNKTS